MIKEADSQNRFPYRAVWGGIAAMFLAFGVGRFAYTPLLPLMREQTGLSLDLAGYLASLMYLGYLAGSVATTRALARFGAFTLLRAGLSMLVLGTWAMSAGAGFPFWAIVMFSIGASSAAIFLSALSLVLGVFLSYGAGWLTALLYAGIGAAIVLLGLVVPEIGAASGWQGAWRFVSCTALAGGGLCHVLLAPYRRTQKAAGHGEPAWAIPGAKRAALWLIIAYALLGFSYTIGGTFMVAMLADLPGLHDQAHLGWVLVGAAVIPSCIIWPLVAARIGEVKTTAILLALLGLANMSIVVWSSPLGVLVAAGLFGMSFLAIPGLVLSRLGKLAGAGKDQIAGLATVIFGVAMVLGPSIGGLLARLTDTFAWSLGMAGAVLFSAAVIALRADLETKSRGMESVGKCVEDCC